MRPLLLGPVPFRCSPSGLLRSAGLLLAVAAACGETEPDRGGLMLVVAKDGPLPIDRLTLTVSSGERVLRDTTYRVPEEAELPTTLAIASNGDPTASVTITVVGWSDEQPLDRRDALVTQVPTDRVAMLSVVLSGQCSDKVELDDDGEAVSTCSAGETCQPESGMCDSAAVNATTLPTYQTGDEDDVTVPNTEGGAPSQAGTGNVAGGAPGGGHGGQDGGSAGFSGAVDGGMSSTCSAGSPEAGAPGMTGGAGGAAGAEAGGAGGTSSGPTAFACPAGPFEAPMMATAVRLVGVPPSDAFNANNTAYTTLDGPVWHDGALFVSEFGTGEQPASRVLRIETSGDVSVAIPNSESAGLAVDAQGFLFAARHASPSGHIASYDGNTFTVLIDKYQGTNLNAPHDLAIHSNGTIYFTDPTYQAPTPAPQAGTRVYRLDPGGALSSIATLTQPLGVTLSPAQDFLYVSAGSVTRYAVNVDGSIGASTGFAGGPARGMGIDCAGNLYVPVDSQVKVYAPSGTQLTTIGGMPAGVTNVAFGGPDHRTLYMTVGGTGSGKGVWVAEHNVPGLPY